VSVATAAPAPPTVPPSPGESCPLCSAPLRPEQEWCLRCGAAARTRLAAPPNWKTPVAVLAVVSALSLGVLAAALVKLAGGSGPAPATPTTTVTAAATPTGPAAPTTTPLPSATSSTPGAGAAGALAPGAVTPGTTSTAPTTGLPGASTVPGAKTPSTGVVPTTGAGVTKRSLSPATERELRRLHLLPGERRSK
jgi:hypothetical protein